MGRRAGSGIRCRRGQTRRWTLPAPIAPRTQRNAIPLCAADGSPAQRRGTAMCLGSRLPIKAPSPHPPIHPSPCTQPAEVLVRRHPGRRIGQPRRTPHAESESASSRTFLTCTTRSSQRRGWYLSTHSSAAASALTPPSHARLWTLCSRRPSSTTSRVSPDARREEPAEIPRTQY